MEQVLLHFRRTTLKTNSMLRSLKNLNGKSISCRQAKNSHQAFQQQPNFPCAKSAVYFAFNVLGTFAGISSFSAFATNSFVYLIGWIIAPALWTIWQNAMSDGVTVVFDGDCIPLVYWESKMTALCAIQAPVASWSPRCRALCWRMGRELQVLGISQAMRLSDMKWHVSYDVWVDSFMGNVCCAFTFLFLLSLRMTCLMPSSFLGGALFDNCCAGFGFGGGGSGAPSPIHSPCKHL